MQNQCILGVISEKTDDSQQSTVPGLVTFHSLQSFRCAFIIIYAVSLLACSFSFRAVVGEKRRAISGPYC